MIGEHRFWVGGIPVAKTHGEPRPRPAVLVLHGLGASSEVQRAECVSLAEHGLASVAVDAPHHGRRSDGWLEALGRAQHPDTHERFLRLLTKAIPEVSRVIDHLVGEGHGPIGVVGISMGAYTALGVARADPRIAATVSLLGSPAWGPARGEITPAIRELMELAPVHDPVALTRAPLLLINAGRDQSVPPDAARHFARSHPANTTYVEYPESEHAMRPGDWGAAWGRTLEFLGKLRG